MPSKAFHNLVRGETIYFCCVFHFFIFPKPAKSTVCFIDTLSLLISLFENIIQPKRLNFLTDLSFVSPIQLKAWCRYSLSQIGRIVWPIIDSPVNQKKLLFLQNILFGAARPTRSCRSGMRHLQKGVHGKYVPSFWYEHIVVLVWKYCYTYDTFSILHRSLIDVCIRLFELPSTYTEKGRKQGRFKIAAFFNTILDREGLQKTVDVSIYFVGFHVVVLSSSRTSKDNQGVWGISIEPFF